MGICKTVKLAGHRGEHVGAFAGQDHGAAGSDTHDPGRLFNQLHSLLDQLGLDQFNGLVHRVRSQTVHLLTAAGRGIGGVELGLCGSRSAVPGQFDFEGVEALQLQAAAEPGNGGFRGAAFICQLGDGHKLYLGMLRQYVVCNPPLCGSQLIIGGMDPFQDVHILFVHSGCLLS